MKVAAFEELLTSVRQAGQIRRGLRKPARVTTFKPTDVKTLRGELGQSQVEFALMTGVSVATLRNWEQGRRTLALALLRVAAAILKPSSKHCIGVPTAVWHNVRWLLLTRDAIEARCARFLESPAAECGRLCRPSVAMPTTIDRRC